MKLILLGIVRNAYLLVLIPAIVAFFRRNAFPKKLKLLQVYIYLCLITEAVAKILWWYKINNLMLLPIFCVLEFLLLSLVYRGAYKNQTLRRATQVFIVLFTVFSVINSFFIQSAQKFNSYSRFAESLFIMFYSISYVVEDYSNTFGESPKKIPFFWINAGILIFFSGNFCLFVLSNYLLSQSQMVNLYVWSYHTLLLSYYYSLITVGLWKMQTK